MQLGVNIAELLRVICFMNSLGSPAGPGTIVFPMANGLVITLQNRLSSRSGFSRNAAVMGP